MWKVSSYMIKKKINTIKTKIMDGITKIPKPSLGTMGSINYSDIIRGRSRSI